MTLNAALRKAKLGGNHFVYRIGTSWHLRGIKTTFTDDDHKQIDWQVHEEERFSD